VSTPSRVLLEFQDVTKTYPGPPEVRALSGVNLQVCTSTFVTISGPSGSGKSTLLTLAGLLDTPTLGSIRVDGVATSSMSERARSEVRGSAIGFVFQSYHLLPRRTLLENVALGGLYTGVRARLRKERALAALESVGLADRAHSLVDHLSGGQKQRVAIARAISSEPRVLLCDEPTGNLDSVSTEGVIGILTTLNERGMTLILVTHDQEIASVGTQRIVVRDGEVFDD
jgi:putative ABC transport system ATP-binding protein